MTTILAIEAATDVCSVALQCHGQILEKFDASARKNTELLLPMINELVATAGIKPQQIDLVAFGRGPGSFTGLRAACGIAQGIAYGCDCPVAPVPTLLAMANAAYQRISARLICAINRAGQQRPKLCCVALCRVISSYSMDFYRCCLYAIGLGLCHIHHLIFGRQRWHHCLWAARLNHRG